MSGPQGFASLQTPRDLLAKLRHDRQRMEADPNDLYAAFDFFVTADHILDWLYPDKLLMRQKKKRQTHRDSERLLRIASHIANGAKHFEAVAQHHTSVQDLSEGFGGFDPRAFDPRSFSPASFAMAGLHVKLDDGSLEHAYVLADDIIAYWDAHLP